MTRGVATGPPPARVDRRVWWVASGFFGIQLAFAVYNTYLPLLYLDFLGSRGLVGLLMGTDNLVGLLLIPVVGVWSDRTRSRWGRRLPFVGLGIPVAAATLLGLPFAAAALWSLIVVEVAFTIAIHGYRGPMAALIVEHVHPRHRPIASGRAQFLGGLGVLVSFVVLSRLYDIEPRATFAAAAGTLIVTGVLVWRHADPHAGADVERGLATSAGAPPTDGPGSPRRQADGSTRGAADDGLTAAGPLRAAVAELAALRGPDRRGPRLVFAAVFTAYVGFSGLQAMFPVYGVAELGLTEGQAAAQLSSFAAALLVGALVAGRLAVRLGNVPTMALGLLVLPGCWLVAAALPTVHGLSVVLLVAGAAWAAVAVPAVALAADLGGRGRIGTQIGLYYVFLMTGQMVGPSVLGTTMDLFGDRAMWVAAAVTCVAAWALVRAGGRHLPPVRRDRSAVVDTAGSAEG